MSSSVEIGRWNQPPVSANVSSEMVTGVVPATTPPMPKLEQESNLGNEIDKQDNNGCFLECVYVPSVDNVRALYMWLWLLAVVVLMPFLVTPPAQ